MTDNIFEAASRQKLRFDTGRGLLATEDLWDLPLTSASKVSLDSIAVAVNKQRKTSTESFVEASPAVDAEIELKFAVVKHIIDVRVAENKARTEANKRREERDLINDLIARKQVQELEGLSLEELQQRAAQLNA